MPTIVVVALRGEHGTEKLLLISQVILSLQLSFAVIPLVLFTERPEEDGRVRECAVGEGVVVGDGRADRGLNGWFLVPFCSRNL